MTITQVRIPKLSQAHRQKLTDDVLWWVDHEKMTLARFQDEYNPQDCDTVTKIIHRLVSGKVLKLVGKDGKVYPRALYSVGVLREAIEGMQLT